MTDTITNSLEMDGLIAGNFPIQRDTVTLKLGQNLARGTVVGAEDGTSATKTASNDGPYNAAAGDTIVIDVDNGGNATATFDAAGATIVDTTSYPVADQDTKNCTFTITGGEYDGLVQTVTFSGATTTALQVAAAINDQCVGLSAVAGAQVTVTTDGQGTDYDVAFGAGTSGLTFAASTAGSGDVGDINAITVAEVKTVIEADIAGVTVTAVGSAFKIESDSVGTTSELDFKSGNLLTIFGLSVEVITGTAGTGYSIICDKDGDDGSEDPQCVLAEDCDASAAATVCAVYRTGTFAADKLVFASGTVAADMEEKMAAKGMYQVTTAS